MKTQLRLRLFQLFKYYSNKGKIINKVISLLINDTKK
jgi:hypothetical protein